MNTMRFVTINRETKSIDTEPYLVNGRYVDGWEFDWAIAEGCKKYPGESFGVAYMNGEVMGGFVVGVGR